MFSDPFVTGSPYNYLEPHTILRDHPPNIYRDPDQKWSGKNTVYTTDYRVNHAPFWEGMVSSGQHASCFGYPSPFYHNPEGRVPNPYHLETREYVRKPVVTTTSEDTIYRLEREEEKYHWQKFKKSRQLTTQQEEQWRQEFRRQADYPLTEGMKRDMSLKYGENWDAML
jgi:hypothetical protein